MKLLHLRGQISKYYGVFAFGQSPDAFSIAVSADECCRIAK